MSYRPVGYYHDAEEATRELVQGWMNSPGHLENILDRESRRIGLGIAIREASELWVHREQARPQRSLFSWAEFTAEEPVKPKCRGCKPQPATLSMFRVGNDTGAGTRGRTDRHGPLTGQTDHLDCCEHLEIGIIGCDAGSCACSGGVSNGSQSNCGYDIYAT